jgi:Mg2+/Co2+ transporter CorB
MAESGHRGARLVSKLLEHPDRLLGVILLGNNFANILASSIATLIALKLYGESAIAVAAFLLTFIVLVFAEVAPKTVAAMNPERVAFPAAFILNPLLVLLRPLIWLINKIANGFLRAFGVTLHRKSNQLSVEELRTAVMEAGALIPETHQTMLLNILDLEKITVDEVMVPRGKIVGIDLEEEWDEIVEQITGSHFTRLPVYRGSLDQVVGVIHVRKVLNLMRDGNFDRESLMNVMAEPYFIPIGTTLNRQLLNFKQVKRRVGLVVDEYGDIQGLVALDEILEEIVGDFTTQTLSVIKDVFQQEDGSYLVKGSTSIRELNRKLGWNLPTEESRTLNGLIVEYLEDIPEPGTSLMLSGYNVEIVRTRGTGVEVARIRPLPSPVASKAEASENGTTKE